MTFEALFLKRFLWTWGKSNWLPVGRIRSSGSFRLACKIRSNSWLQKNILGISFLASNISCSTFSAVPDHSCRLPSCSQPNRVLRTCSRRSRTFATTLVKRMDTYLINCCSYFSRPFSNSTKWNRMLICRESAFSICTFRNSFTICHH